MKLRPIMVVACFGLVAAACGGGGGTTAEPTTPSATTPSPSPSEATACAPSGPELQIQATGTAFNTKCLAAPADTAFTIEFEVTDGNSHNVVIENDDKFFDGEVFSGPKTTTYEVDPIPAGTYTFYCKVHAGSMNGTFVAA